MVVFMAAHASAQSAPVVDDKGLVSTVSFTEAHDSSLGWAAEIDSTTGYDFNRNWNLSAGVPIYLVQPAQQTSGTTAANNSYGALGDAFVNLNYKVQGSLGYAATVTGTVPTGDTAHGISSGRFTFGWNNHLEHEISRFTPFAEAGVANSNTTLERIHGSGAGIGKHSFLSDYTSLGGIARLSGGSSIDLLHSLTFTASAYDELPFGNQKIYSRSIPHGAAAGLVNPKGNGKPFQLAAVTQGTSSIAGDNGFEAVLSACPTARVEFAVSYQRSVHDALNTMAITASYRFGHLPPKTRN